MLYYFLIVYLILFYIRPSEWVPGLVGTPLILVMGVASILLIFLGVLTGRYPRVLTGKVERMLFGLCVAIALSHFSHSYFGGAVDSLTSFIPTITGFFLFTCALENRKKITMVIIVLIALTTILAYEGRVQHNTGFAHGGMEPIYQTNTTLDGVEEKLPRIRWYGVFNDPNDLGLALVLVVPFLLDMLMRRSFIVPIMSLPLITLAIYYTNSRGTILAGLVAISSYFIIYYRSVRGVLIGVFAGLVLFFFGPSRMASISAEEESASGRIQAWYEAYQMFKSNPVFGVGQGMFTDYHRLTAHNSFVLIMAELGIVGLFFYTGLYYFPLRWLWVNVFKVDICLIPRAEIGLISATFASLIGIMAAMFFLSRAYMMIPYMMIALAVAEIRNIGEFSPINNAAIDDNHHHYRNILVLTLLQIIGINIVVKIAI